MPDHFYTSREERATWIARRFTDRFEHARRVLDVGCDTRQLASVLPEHIAYYGIDIGGDPHEIVDLESAHPLPFADASYDVIVCLDVLEHLESIHRTIDELCRISSHTVIITLPNPIHSACSYIAKALLPFRKTRGFGAHARFYGIPHEIPADRHRWFFSYTDAVSFIEARARRNGYRLAKIETDLDYPHTSYKLRVRWLLSHLFGIELLADSIVFVLQKRSPQQ